jgi:hypothetical protein
MSALYNIFLWHEFIQLISFIFIFLLSFVNLNKQVHLIQSDKYFILYD